MNKRKLLRDEVALLPKETLLVFEAFVKAQKEIYLVGAGVRSILRGERPKDCDFTTNANPEEIQAITKKWEPFYDNDFGTVGIPFETELGDEVYEITPYRTEGTYTDRRRPDEVRWGDSLEEDVQRRDFTMNAVVLGPDGNEGFVMIDYLNGLSDFENRLIKAVGDANTRFSEDALRMMRAVRFASQLSFSIEPETLKAVTKNSQLLKNISRERVRDELMKVLKSDYPADGIHLLVTTGLMEWIIPELLLTRGVPQTGHHTLDVYDHMLGALRECPSRDPLIRLATLLHDIGKPQTRRLRCGKCGWVMKEKDLFESGETAKTTMYKCPRCGNLISEHAAGTFYGHEVVGARMVAEIGDRLRLPRKDVEKLVILVRWHMFSYDSKMTDAAIRRFIKRVGKENINDMMLLRIGDRKGGGSKTTSWRLQELQKRIGEQLFEPLEIRDMVLKGEDIMKILEIKPGPKIGKILKALFEEVLEDTSKNNREYLLGRVKELQ